VVLRGSLEERVGPVVERAGPLCVVVKPAGVEHADRFGPDGATTAQVTLSKVAEDMAAESGHWPGRWRWIGAGPSGRSLLRMLAPRRPDDPQGAGFDDGLTELLATLGEEPAVRRARPPAWLIRAREALTEESLPIAVVAARERTHPVVLARLFRRCFGMPPTAWRRRARIQRTAMLLADTRRSLAEIALDAGYSDQAHMTRDLRAVLGATPSLVRRIVSLP